MNGTTTEDPSSPTISKRAVRSRTLVSAISEQLARGRDCLLSRLIDIVELGALQVADVTRASPLMQIVLGHHGFQVHPLGDHGDDNQ
jgi:hypothetical protein